MIIHGSIYALLDNPNLPMIMARSTYSLDEIKATLATAEKLKAEYEMLYNRAHKILDPIDHFERFDNEKALANLILDYSSIHAGVHNEPFPLTQWEKAIARQRTHNRKIEKALREFENVKETHP
jgi:hypothetical protein